MELLKATERDFKRIVQLNANEEVQTSPMNLSRLRALHQLSSYHKVAKFNQQTVGFLLAMDQDAIYPNNNFTWFKARYCRFIYIDRIVVSKAHARMKIGTGFYKDIFSFAKQNNIDKLLCEYNIEPPNLASKAFHDRFGFKQVGTQRVANDCKLVSLQAADVTQ